VLGKVGFEASPPVGVSENLFDDPDLVGDRLGGYAFQPFGDVALQVAGGQIGKVMMAPGRDEKTMDDIFVAGEGGRLYVDFGIGL